MHLTKQELPGEPPPAPGRRSPWLSLEGSPSTTGRGLPQGGPSAAPEQLDDREACQVHPGLSSEAVWDDAGNQYMEPTLKMMLTQATLGPLLENQRCRLFLFQAWQVSCACTLCASNSGSVS